MITKSDIKIISFGEILFDIIDHQEYIGGAPLNFAAHMANLGVSVAMLSSVGCDDRGDAALDTISKLKIDSRYICRDNTHPTGTVEVELTESGQPAYNIHKNVAYDNISYTSRAIEKIVSLNWDAFYFGTLAQRDKVSRDTLVQFVSNFDKEIFFDVNLRQSYYSKEILEDSLGFATIVKLNDDELQIISELLYKQDKTQKEFCSLICQKYGIKIIILTLGEKGCCLYHENNFFKLPAVKVEVVDTVGAGDAFSAGFLYMYLSGHSPAAAVEFANNLAAGVAAQRGAIPSDYLDSEKL